jgi:hypothetical protein
MITQRIDELTYADIERWVSDQETEGRSLDYKLKLPSKDRPDDTKEFLADVSSFANASGGHLVYGVKTRKENGKNTEIPESIEGVGEINGEQDILRLEQMIRDNIHPRIQGFGTRVLKGKDKQVVVIYIPRSWNAPHMVGKVSSRFFSRNSVGKHPLDVTELRHAFAMSESVGERIRAFRDERIGRILAGDPSVNITSGAAVVLHMIPIRAFVERTTLAIQTIQEATRNVKPIYDMGWDRRNTFDGVCISTKEGDRTAGYVLCFRNGAIEAVDTNILRLNVAHGAGKIIPSQPFENKLIANGDELYKVLKRLEVAPPFVCFLSLLNVKGFVCSSGLRYEPATHRIDRDHLLMPDELVEDANASADGFLRPALDILWQSCGGNGSPFYQEDGKWRLQ